MSLGIEAHCNQNPHHLAEVTTTSRTRTTCRISTVSHKVMISTINQKESTTMAHKKMTTVRMSMMNFFLRHRTIGHQRSSIIVLLSATTRLTKTPNTMLDMLSKTEEIHTIRGSLQAVT